MSKFIRNYNVISTGNEDFNTMIVDKYTCIIYNRSSGHSDKVFYQMINNASSKIKPEPYWAKHYTNSNVMHRYFG